MQNLAKNPTQENYTKENGKLFDNLPIKAAQ